MTIAKAVRDRIAPLIPAGYSVDDLCIGMSTARIVPVSGEDREAKMLLARVQKEAGPPLINALGRPTVMRVVSWVGHAGVPNRNRDYFVPAELEKVAPTLFAAPDLGVMDFNHSAVRMFSDDPKMVGVWYKAEWAYDQTANAGKGAWGVLATGMMFSWLFPDVADKVLAAQSRNDGALQVSWTWIPGSVEIASDAAGEFRINHNPVFFTVALLDVPPADPNASGVGTEDATETEQALRLKVTAERLAELAAAAQNAATVHHFDIERLWRHPALATAQEDAMTGEELKAKIAEMEAETKRQVAALEATHSTSLKDLTDKLEAVQASLVTVEAANAAFATQIDELTTSKDAATIELTAAAEKITALEVQLAEAKTALEAFEAAKVAAEAERQEHEITVRLATRIAELPEAYRQAHEKRSDESKTRVEAKWRAMSDEDWTQYLQDEIALVPAKVGFVLRSAALGNLPKGTNDNDEDLSDRARRLKK